MTSPGAKLQSIRSAVSQNSFHLPPLGCFQDPRVASHGSIRQQWGADQEGAQVDTACTTVWLSVGLGNSSHMVPWRPCHAWRAQVLFLSNKISDYSQAESDMVCLVTLNILLRDPLTQNSQTGCDLSPSQILMPTGMAVGFLQF